MSEAKQIGLFEQKADKAKRQVEYVPPETQAVDQFAQQVCDELVQRGETAFADPEIVDGFASFLNFVAEVTAKHLNRKNSLREGK